MWDHWIFGSAQFSQEHMRHSISNIYYFLLLWWYKYCVYIMLVLIFWSVFNLRQQAYKIKYFNTDRLNSLVQFTGFVCLWEQILNLYHWFDVLVIINSSEVLHSNTFAKFISNTTWTSYSCVVVVFFLSFFFLLSLSLFNVLISLFKYLHKMVLTSLC